LVVRPKLLLLDEPLSNLDAKLREEMRVEIKELTGRLGISTIYVTHDQAEALSMSDRIAVMSAGRIEQLATPLEVYERPATEFVAGFVGTTNVVTGRAASSSEGRTTIETGAGSFDVEDTVEVGTTVRYAVRPEKIRVVDELSPETLHGTVQSSRYLGDSTHWAIRLDDGSQWSVLRQNDGSMAPLKPGARVGLVWDAEHAVQIGA
jgi:spermidine/putrescine transport system ATP-binding protein